MLGSPRLMYSVPLSTLCLGDGEEGGGAEFWGTQVFFLYHISTCHDMAEQQALDVRHSAASAKSTCPQTTGNACSRLLLHHDITVAHAVLMSTRNQLNPSAPTQLY